MIRLNLLMPVWLSMLGMVVLSGCSQHGPTPLPEGVNVSGKILLPNGRPLAGGILILRPESGLYGATAQIQPDGSFSLRNAVSEQVQPGKYQVFVRLANPNLAAFKNAVHARYQESSEDGNSDLFVEIQDATDSLVIRLKS